MGNKIFAPFTEEQVKKLQAWQNYGEGDPVNINGFTVRIPIHPFTCCSHEGCERLKQPNEGALIPTTDGWVCPCGKYTQNWCHDFMVEEQEQDPVPPGKSLYKHTLDMLRFAKEKGFGNYYYYVNPPEVNNWREDHEGFCAHCCAGVQLWLRKIHNIIVWVEPIMPERWYKCFVKYFGLYRDAVPGNGSSSYEHELLTGITFALNTLPNERQDGANTTGANA